MKNEEHIKMTTTEKMIAEVEGWKKHSIDGLNADVYTEKFVNAKGNTRVALIINNRQMMSFSIDLFNDEKEFMDSVRFENELDHKFDTNLFNIFLSRKNS